MVFCVLHAYSSASDSPSPGTSTDDRPGMMFRQNYPDAADVTYQRGKARGFRSNSLERPQDLKFRQNYPDAADVTYQRGKARGFRSNSLDSSGDEAEDERPQARTIKDELCVEKSGKPATCNNHGESYTWCYTSKWWDYCTKAESGKKQQHRLSRHQKHLKEIESRGSERPQASEPDTDSKDEVDDLTFARQQHDLRGIDYGKGNDYQTLPILGPFTGMLGYLAKMTFESVELHDYSEVDRCKELFVQQYALNLERSPAFDWYINQTGFEDSLKLKLLKAMDKFNEHDDGNLWKMYQDDPSSHLFAPEPKYRKRYGHVERKMRYLMCYNWRKNSRKIRDLGPLFADAQTKIHSCDPDDDVHKAMRQQICPYDCPVMWTNNCGANEKIHQNDLFEESVDELQVYEPVEEAEQAEPTSTAWRPNTQRRGKK